MPTPATPNADPDADGHEPAGAWRVRAVLLLVWALASFGVAFVARELDQVLAGWPLNYWLAAQGAVLVFIGVVVANAWWMNRAEARAPAPGAQDD